MTILSLLLLFVTIMVLGVLFVKQKYRYWKDRGLPYLEPSFPKGNLGNLGKTEHVFELTKRIYFEFKKNSCETPLGGIFVTFKPAVVVLDLDFVKTMLVKEFHNFNDRGFYLNERDDPIDANLLNIKGEPWKNLRHKLTPTFTCCKMKLMTPTMVDISKKFVKRLGEDLKNEKDLELSDYLFRFTIDIIGSCAFGLNCNSINDRDSEFLRMGKRIFSQSKGRLIKLIFVTMFRELAYNLRIRWTLKNVADFYSCLVTEIVSHREKNKIQKNDFLNLLIQLKNKDTQKISDGLTLNEVISNTYLFLTAGYETSAITLQFCLLELAHHPKIQEHLRKEIKIIFDQYGEEITYEALSDLKYLDQVIYETLRKHPVVGFLARIIENDYKVENTDVVVGKGVQVFIPTLGIHHDPDIYPDPEKFDPERFSSEAIYSRHPCAFLGFGAGPRNCIGLRFAMMEMKIVICYLLMKFNFLPSDKTRYPIQYSLNNSLLAPVDGCWLKVEEI